MNPFDPRRLQPKSSLTLHAFCSLGILAIAAPCYAQTIPSASQVRLSKVRVCYRTLSPYPLSTENVEVLAVVWVIQPPFTGNGHPIEVPYSVRQITNDGPQRLWMTGTDGFGLNRISFGIDGKFPERVSENTDRLIRPWPSEWPKIHFAWAEHRQFGSRLGSFHYGYQYKDSSVAWNGSWGSSARLTPGVHRYSVTATLDAPLASGSSLQVGSLSSRGKMYSTRIAVRDGLQTDRYLQYVSMFERTPYEYGGWTFGGGVSEARGTTSGRGIDCSGIVWCGIRFAGASSPSNRFSTSGLTGFVKSIPASALQPGDLMNKAGSHVMSVWQREGDQVTTLESTAGTSREGSTGAQKVSHSLARLVRGGYVALRLLYRISPGYSSHAADTAPENSAVPNASAVPNHDAPNAHVPPPLVPERRPRALPPDSLPNLPRSPARLPPAATLPPSDHAPATPSRTHTGTLGSQRPSILVQQRTRFRSAPRFVVVNGTTIHSQIRPFLRNGAVFVAARPLLTKAGLTVSYVSSLRKTSMKGGVLTTSSHPFLALQTGSRTARIDGENIRMDLAPRITKRRMAMPISLLTQVPGWKLMYNRKNRYLYLSTK